MTSPKAGGGDDGCDEPLLEGPAASTPRGPGHPDYAEVLNGKVCTVPPGWPTWVDDVVRMPIGGVEVEGELAHVHFETEDDAPEDTPELVFDKVVVPAVAPMVATLQSPTFHGAPLVPGIGSIDVFAEGKGVFRMLRDAVVCPAATPLPHGGGVVVPIGPPPTVFVNGFPVARAGDAVMEPLGGPNPIAMGALTVFAGPPAPPMVAVSPVGRPADKPALERAIEWVDGLVEFDVRAHADVHVGEGSGQMSGGVGADTDAAVLGGDAHVEGSGTLVRVDGEIVVELSVFGWTMELLDQELDGGLGHWKGHGDVVFDPVQRRPGASGDIEFSVFGGDDE